MLKKVIPGLCLLAVTAVIVVMMPTDPVGQAALQGEYDGYIVYPDQRSGRIIGMVDGHPLEALMELQYKPYYGGAQIVYNDGERFILGGMMEIYIAESFDLKTCIEDIKLLLDGKSALFRVVKNSDAYLSAVQKQISNAMVAVRNPKTPETAKFFEPGVMDAILDIKSSAVYHSDNNIVVMVDWLNEDKIKILKELFPYDCIVYQDGTGIINVATDLIVA